MCHRQPIELARSGAQSSTRWQIDARAGARRLGFWRHVAEHRIALLIAFPQRW